MSTILTSRLDPANLGNHSHHRPGFHFLPAPEIFAEIVACTHASAAGDPCQKDRLTELENQLHGIDMAIGQVRIYLLGFHRTLGSAQALAQGNIEVPHKIAEKERPLLVVLPITKLR